MPLRCFSVRLCIAVLTILGRGNDRRWVLAGRGWNELSGMRDCIVTGIYALCSGLRVLMRVLQSHRPAGLGDGPCWYRICVQRPSIRYGTKPCPEVRNTGRSSGIEIHARIYMLGHSKGAACNASRRWNYKLTLAMLCWVSVLGGGEKAVSRSTAGGQACRLPGVPVAFATG